MKFIFFPKYVNNFCDAGQVPILGYFEACFFKKQKHKQSYVTWIKIRANINLQRCFLVCVCVGGGGGGGWGEVRMLNK